MSDFVVKLREGADFQDRVDRVSAKCSSSKLPNALGSNLSEVQRLQKQYASHLPRPELFTLAHRESIEEVRELLHQFEGDEDVDFVAVAPASKGFELLSDAEDEPLEQRHKHAAPVGIDAEAAYRLPKGNVRPGGTGDRVAVCVCEPGYDVDQPDLPPASEVKVVSNLDGTLERGKTMELKPWGRCLPLTMTLE